MYVITGRYRKGAAAVATILSRRLLDPSDLAAERARVDSWRRVEEVGVGTLERASERESEREGESERVSERERERREERGRERGRERERALSICHDPMCVCRHNPRWGQSFAQTTFERTSAKEAWAHDLRCAMSGREREREGERDAREREVGVGTLRRREGVGVRSSRAGVGSRRVEVGVGGRRRREDVGVRASRVGVGSSIR